MGEHAAVYADVLPGDEGGLVGGQEDNQRGDVLRTAEAWVSACRSMVACTASRPGFSGISMKPGDIALHRMPCFPNSAAAYLVRLISAAFDAP